MTAEEYSNSLDYQYCRSKKYVKPDIFNDSDFSFRKNNNRYDFVWERKTQRKNIIVQFSCITSTMEILGFECSCECQSSTYSNHYRPVYYEPPITRNDKAEFKLAFQKYVSQTPQERIENELYITNIDENNRTNKFKKTDSMKSIEKKKEAEKSLQDWISGKECCIPDVIVSLRWAPELVDKCLSYIIPYSEKNQHDWPLYAQFIIAAYLKENGDKNNLDLKKIYNIARRYQKELNGFNPWQYRFVENPLEKVLFMLSFLDE